MKSSKAAMIDRDLDLYGYSYGNLILYKMCEDCPGHTGATIDQIISKIWLIGRSYAASIERGAKEGFCIESLALEIKNSDLDWYIDQLRTIDRITADNLPVLLKAHKRLTELFFGATGKQKRSLASKYLHFHAPNAVFIYDSVVNEKVRSKLKGQRFGRGKKYDDNYEGFSLRVIFYRDNLLEKQIGRHASPRLIDAYLYPYGPGKALVGVLQD